MQTRKPVRRPGFVGKVFWKNNWRPTGGLLGCSRSGAAFFSYDLVHKGLLLSFPENGVPMALDQRSVRSLEIYFTLPSNHTIKAVNCLRIRIRTSGQPM
jgi:hypothetical protein